jgi:hypothetical protein
MVLSQQTDPPVGGGGQAWQSTSTEHELGHVEPDPLLPPPELLLPEADPPPLDELPEPPDVVEPELSPFPEEALPVDAPKLLAPLGVGEEDPPHEATTPMTPRQAARALNVTAFMSVFPPCHGLSRLAY